MNRTLDLVTWQQFEEMASARQSSSIASGTSKNINGSPAELFIQLMSRKSRVAVEWGDKNMQCGEKSAKN